MDGGESIDDYNKIFWGYCLGLPFRKVSRKVQCKSIVLVLITKIQTQVNAQHHKGIQDLMHATTVASLVQIEDPSTLMLRHAGILKKKKPDVPRFHTKSD